jgi:hypothetical protein
MLVMWLWVVSRVVSHGGGPSGSGLGVDVTAYLSAAQVVNHGGNPFDHQVLYRTEVHLLHRHGLAAPSRPSLVRVAQPPMLFWILQPLVNLPFQATAVVWILCMYGCFALGFLGSLKYSGWSNWLFPSLLFLAMPQVILSVINGNIVAVVFAAIGCSLLCVDRYPFAAGCLLGLCLLKPQVSLPIALLIVVFCTPWKRLVAGFCFSVAIIVSLSAVTTGVSSLGWWVRGIGDFSSTIPRQGDIPSLAGLYEPALAC